jgi:hypothetical protein
MNSQLTLLRTVAITAIAAAGLLVGCSASSRADQRADALDKKRARCRGVGADGEAPETGDHNAIPESAIVHNLGIVRHGGYSRPSKAVGPGTTKSRPPRSSGRRKR